MTLTHEELKTLVAEQIDEITLLDLLEVNSENLVNAFPEELENKRHQLLQMLSIDDCLE